MLGCLSTLPVVPAEIRIAATWESPQPAARPRTAGRSSCRTPWDAPRSRSTTTWMTCWARRHADAQPARGGPRPQRGAHFSASTSAAAAHSSARSAPSSMCRVKSRFRTADDLEAICSRELKQGITAFFINDDNMACNKHWEDFFDRSIELKENEGIDVSLIIQVDTQCHRIPNFIAKALGHVLAFIGLENVNPDNLLAAKKRRTRSPSTAGCCRPCTPPQALRPGRATSRWFPRTRATTCATWRSSRRIAARLRAVHPDAAAGLRGPPDAGNNGHGWTLTLKQIRRITASCTIPRG